jgi:TonB family protein
MVGVLLLCGIYAAAETPKEIAKRLGSKLQGRACVLTEPRQGKKLTFSPEGKLLGNPARGTWPAHAGFLIESVKAHKAQIELKGNRLLIYFDTKGKRQAAVTSSSLEIDLELGQNAGSGDVDEAMGHILMVRGSSPADVPPPEIPDSALASLGENKIIVIGKMPDGNPIYQVTRPVEPPRPTRTPDPVYPEELRKKRIQGTAVLRVVTDADGTVHSIKIVKTPEPGFEVAAADAVKDWLFTPAKLSGQSVAVVIDIEVNFRLY